MKVFWIGGGYLSYREQMKQYGAMLFIAFLTTQSDFPRPLAAQEGSVVLEGNSLDRSHYA